MSVFLKKKKKKHSGMVDTKFNQKIKKQKLTEYRKKYYKMRKNTLL